jgi:hypothetical protein
MDPEGDGGPITVDILAGTYVVEWFDVTSRVTATADALTVESAGMVELSSPFPAGPAVLYLGSQ